MKRDRSPLDPRSQRIVDEVKGRETLTRDRFVSLLSIMSSATDIEYVRQLAAVAKDGMVPGDMEWSFTSRLMVHRDIRGFCQTCGGALNGKGCEVDIFAENCPAEIGILKYAGCSANA